MIRLRRRLKGRKGCQESREKGVTGDLVEKAVELGMFKAAPKKPVGKAAAKADER